MKHYFFIVLFIVGFMSNKVEAQNKDMYVVVPMSYDFVKNKDAYRLNTLTRYLFKQEGFTVFFDEETLPDDLFKDRCKAVYVDVDKVDGGFLVTRLQITVKDCYGNAILTSKVAETKEKNLEKAYQSTLRDAFESLNLNALKLPKKTEPKPETVTEPVPEVPKAKPEYKKEVQTVTTRSNTLYAQKTTNGYQVVNAEPKIVMVLVATSSKSVFIVKGKNAVVFRKNNQWVYSENKDGKASETVLNIKF